MKVTKITFVVLINKSTLEVCGDGGRKSYVVFLLLVEWINYGCINNGYCHHTLILILHRLNQWSLLNLWVSLFIC